MNEPILEVQNLVKVYDNNVHALRGVSFKVIKGEFLVIIGLSGSGKSTLLRCLNGLNAATSGKVIFNKKPPVDIVQLKGSRLRDVRKHIAMIFQHFNLINRHSVISNVLMGSLTRTGTVASLLGLFSDSEKAKALKYLDLVGIKEKAYIKAGSLSGGQQQRVAIARALCQGPDILLADEPVASLDPATCHTVMEYLKKVNQELGITVVCNLHFLSLVRQYATRVIALKQGEIVYEGLPGDITEEWFRKIYGEAAREVHVN
jgi:phosphonate transport system ATP-binding protein